MLNITTGKIDRALKVVAYGSEGIGKTTFAAAFPEPLFIDTEGTGARKSEFTHRARTARTVVPLEPEPTVLGTENFLGLDHTSSSGSSANS